jgi:hypothetical protein
MATHYTVFNKQTNVTKEFKNRTKAYNYADKKDLEHGAIIKKDDYDNANEFQAIECYTQKGKQKFEPFNGNSYAGALYTNKRHFNLAT